MSIHRHARRAVLLPTIMLTLMAAPPAVNAACGPSMRSVQERLVDLGFPVGPVDGCSGPATAAGVLAFQRAHRLSADGIVGPVTRRALGKARRPRPLTAGAGSRIEVDLARQIVLRIHSGRVAAVYAASTGQPGHATPSGTFRVFRKDPRSWSIAHRVWMPWASYFHGGIAVHAGDVSRPRASHGCVRVPPPLAASLYAAMPTGTNVTVR